MLKISSESPAIDCLKKRMLKVREKSTDWATTFGETAGGERIDRRAKSWR